MRPRPQLGHLRSKARPINLAALAKDGRRDPIGPTFEPLPRTMAVRRGDCSTRATCAALDPLACGGMQELIDLYRHNAWANERVFALAQDVDAGLLETEAPGTRGTVKSTLAHLARAEYLYLSLIQGKPRQSLESREDYEAHDLAWLRRHLQEIAEGFIGAIQTATPEVLARRLDIAVDFPVTARDGLLQVLTHSSQHRSQVLSWLSAQGVATPDLDYVLMLGERPGGAVR
jgi:uncharacterized damage-inducible protein DinB